MDSVHGPGMALSVAVGRPSAGPGEAETSPPTPAAHIPANMCGWGQAVPFSRDHTAFPPESYLPYGDPCSAEPLLQA